MKISKFKTSIFLLLTLSLIFGTINSNAATTKNGYPQEYGAKYNLKVGDLSQYRYTELFSKTPEEFNESYEQPNGFFLLYSES